MDPLTRNRPYGVVQKSRSASATTIKGCAVTLDNALRLGRHAHPGRLKHAHVADADAVPPARWP
jgi:hypothetical protein